MSTTDTSTTSSSNAQPTTHTDDGVRRVDIHAFGDCLNDADKRVHPETGEPLSMTEAMKIALQRLDPIVDLGSLDLITTGLNEDVTHALDDAIDEVAGDADIEFEVFMMKAKQFLDDDDVNGWDEAWAKMAQRRNETITSDKAGTTGTDLMVRITDGGRSGEHYMRQGMKGGVPVISISLSDCIDWSQVDFGGGE